MRRLALVLMVLAAGMVVFAGCGGSDDDGGDGGSQDNVDLTQKKDITIAMVTHGDGGSFWSVAKKGAEQAAKDMGVTLKYSESNNDPEEQATPRSRSSRSTRARTSRPRSEPSPTSARPRRSPARARARSSRTPGSAS